jgi:hypothetical protein
MKETASGIEITVDEANGTICLREWGIREDGSKCHSTPFLLSAVSLAAFLREDHSEILKKAQDSRIALLEGILKSKMNAASVAQRELDEAKEACLES